MATQPDISSILAALAQQQSGATPQGPSQGATPQPGYSHQLPPQTTPQPLSVASYLPQPTSTGSLDLSAIKPVNSGQVSIADAIAKAKSIAADRGVVSYDPRSGTPRDDPRLAGRGYHDSRSRSRSPSRRDAYSNNPYRDERREDPRRGNHRRSPSPDRDYRASGGGGGSGASDVDTIRVKSSLVGLIIGRNGENLRKVEGETGARVQFLPARDAQATERSCTITGNLHAREGAKAAIFAIIDENGGNSGAQDKGSYTAGMPGRAKVNLPALRDGEASTQIMVPDKTVGLIIGRGGETIKDLQERSGCHVNIVGESKSVNGFRPVNLIGSERATAMAKELILEIVESDSRVAGMPQQPAPREQRSAFEGRTSAPPPGGQSGQIDKTIHVPSEAVGMIIGKGGETIKDTQRSTGCKINVNQPFKPDITRKIDLSGTAQALAEAERIIWEKVETVRQRDAAAGRTHASSMNRDQSQPGYDAGYAQASMPAYGQSYMPSQQAQQTPQAQAYQMPQYGQQAQPAQAAADPNAADPYAPYGGQAAFYAWYTAQMANMQQQQQQQGGPPGTQ